MTSMPTPAPTLAMPVTRPRNFKNQREVVVMKIWGGLTFEKISEVLDTSKNTVASRYRYALQAMKGRMDQEVIYD